jgi:hypothetical protein
MRWTIVPLIAVCLFCCGCGDVSVNASWGGGGGEASGFVSIVHLSFVFDSQHNSVPVTVVSLRQTLGSQDLTLCGSRAEDFPLNSYVVVKYTPGPQCSTVVALTISR